MISLIQQGTQTARNRKRKMVRYCSQVTVSPNAIIIKNSEAQVLIRT
jgi:hypothetical protein